MRAWPIGLMLLLGCEVRPSESEISLGGVPTASDDAGVFTNWLATARLGASYKDAFALEGWRQSPRSWVVASGRLPLGLFLTPDGFVQGLPEEVGRFPFSVGLASGEVEPWAWTFKVETIEIPSQVLPPARRLESYQYELQTTPDEFVVWSIVEGQLPSWITLGRTSGRLNGAPLDTGTFEFTVRAVDRYDISDTRALSLTVRPAR